MSRARNDARRTGVTAHAYPFRDPKRGTLDQLMSTPEFFNHCGIPISETSGVWAHMFLVLATAHTFHAGNGEMVNPTCVLPMNTSQVQRHLTAKEIETKIYAHFPSMEGKLVVKLTKLIDGDVTFSVSEFDRQQEQDTRARSRSRDHHARACGAHEAT